MRSPARRPRSAHLALQALETRDTPADVWSTESFAGPAPPADWDVHPAGNLRPAATPTDGPDGAVTLPVGARAWEQAILPADAGVQTAVRLDGHGSAQLLLRGRNLGGDKPTYYAATVGRDGSVRIQRVVNGVPKLLARTAVPAWAAGTWVTASFQARGSHLTLTLRNAAGEYLRPDGSWQPGEAGAVQATDAKILGDGRAGIARPARPGKVLFGDYKVLLPAGSPVEPFDTTPAGGLPAGWSGWGSDASARPRTAAQAASLGGPSGAAGRAWVSEPVPSDVRVRATVPVHSLVPAVLFARGRALDTPTPTYYATSVVRGTQVKLLRVVGGTATTLAALKTRTYLSQVKLEVSLTAQGDHLQVRVRRADTGQWLTAQGDWKATPAVALAADDRVISGPGQVGIGRSAGAAGSVSWDDFSAAPADGDVTPPRPKAQVIPRGVATQAGTVAGFVRFQADVRAGAVDRVEFLVDGAMVSRRTATPYRHDFETRNLANGRHVLTVRAFDPAGNMGESSTTFTVANRSTVPRPEVPRHSPHIRYAALAYTGNPMGPDEQELLRKRVDLVIPNERFLTRIDAVAPDTPQLVYSNVSNLYQDLLTDWLAYADRSRLDREAAFYHVAAPTPFTGNSASSQPVAWFWNVGQGPAEGVGVVKSFTTAARDARANDVSFGAAGQALHVGYPDRFRELNITLGQPGAAGWTGHLEYPSAADAAGKPVVWKPLPTASDSTDGFRQSGQLTFDPPADWVSAVVGGSAARLYYVRIRTPAGTTAESPVATSILGRDFVQANGGTTGTIPAFDAAADRNADGYLSDAEYAGRRSRHDARFVSESRWFYPGYGQMRYVTNPGGSGVAGWAGEYHRRFLAARPLADGVFMDNSGGRLPADPAVTVESRETYASDYGATLGAVNRAIAPRWVLANTVAGGVEADRVVRQVPGTLEEFALRPLAHSWKQFEETAEAVRRKLAVSEPSGFLVLDTLSTGGSPTDPRTQVAALAYYYLLADPDSTFFMTWGGEEPSSAWSRHWFDAIGYDVGRPTGTWTEFATGADPSSVTQKYAVYAREYQNALVLYKPLSYTQGQGAGTTGTATATTHILAGSYRPLNADGTLGPVVTSVTLRNGEGAVLVRA